METKEPLRLDRREGGRAFQPESEAQAERAGLTSEGRLSRASVTNCIGE